MFKYSNEYKVIRRQAELLPNWKKKIYNNYTTSKHARKLPITPRAQSNYENIIQKDIKALAHLLEIIAYGNYEPWVDLYREKYCDNCPVDKVLIKGYTLPLFLHECDYEDGKCPHADPIIWWLLQEFNEKKEK